MNEMAIKSNDPLSFGIIEPIFRAAEQLHFSLESNPTSVTDNLALANTLIVLQNIIAVSVVVCSILEISLEGRQWLKLLIWLVK